jgi:hypothetical protein
VSRDAMPWITCHAAVAGKSGRAERSNPRPHGKIDAAPGVQRPEVRCRPPAVAVPDDEPALAHRPPAGTVSHPPTRKPSS